jgi:hypothetical protein
MTSPTLRAFLAALAAGAALAALPAAAQLPDFGLKSLVGRASDSALDRLAQPGAFSADDAIRIALPGGKGVSSLMGLAGKAGLTGDLDAALNRAAEQAAAQAKPIFRAAIDKASFGDAVAIARGGSTGATDYLRQNTGAEIQARLVPLVRGALQSSGALGRAPAQLSALGLNEGALADYVARKTSDGIFTYVGREEARMRQDPIGAGRELLKGLQMPKF